MKTEDEEMMKLLRASLAKTGESEAPERDLWPVLLQRRHERAAAPWFDWALLAGIAALVALFPAAIPVFLYYL
jgi:hypothetical protein